MNCLFERVQDKLRVLCRRCFPAEDPVSEDIDHERHIYKATPGRNEREVGHPKFIGPRCPELAICRTRQIGSTP